MLKDIPKDQLQEVLFSNLVLSLSNAAMMGMGKTPNPVNGSVETDLDMAEMNIEMLNMLVKKTSGNLSEKENALISTTLTNLRLTYLDELKKTK